MKKYKHFGIDEIRKLKDLYSKGETPKQIAMQIKVSVATVTSWISFMRKNGYKRLVPIRKKINHRLELLRVAFSR